MTNWLLRETFFGLQTLIGEMFRLNSGEVK